MTTPSRIQEIAERCEKASEGPWVYKGHGEVRSESGAWICLVYGISDQDTENALTIAAARTDIPFLLEQLTKAVEVIEWIAAHEKDSPGLSEAMNERARYFLKEMRSDE